ncbi:hypothetical protein F441_03903 [Phytophthora nicotianae CJ01A1]|nr:hypothetical protein F441_03903 [Phytophthora nicotianae CJ01A1]
MKHAILTSFKAQPKIQNDAAFLFLLILCTSATGVKLKSFIAFAGKPGHRVASQVTSQAIGCVSVGHTVQEKACSQDGIREMLETECTTLPPGVTALGQPMDVSIMGTFTNKTEDLYV